VAALPQTKSRISRRLIAAIALLAASLALASPARSRAEAPPADFFGIAEPLVHQQDFFQMRQAGASALRLQFLLGDAKKKRNGSYDWSYFDYLVTGGALSGLDIVPVLYGIPPWISKDRSATPLTSKAAMAEWDAFLKALVQRYGPLGSFWVHDPAGHEPYLPYHPIETWQIWNEPNSITWWEPKPSPQQYASLLRRSAADIRSVDPNAQIMTAGIVAHPTNAHAIPGNKFVKKMLRTPGTGDAMDVFAFHPYSPTVKNAVNQVKSVRHVLNRGGESDTPIWITEIGWGSKGKGLPLVKKPKDQERSLVQLMQKSLAMREKYGIGRVFWYHWRDGPDQLCRWCKTSGLLTRRSKPKKLFDLYRGVATGTLRDQRRTLP
jgi:hypothetical protein